MHYNYFQLNGNIFCSFLITLLYFALKEEIIFIFNFVLITLTTNACANYFGWNFNYVQLLLHYEIISRLQFYFDHIDDKRMRKLFWLKFQLCPAFIALWNNFPSSVLFSSYWRQTHAQIALIEISTNFLFFLTLFSCSL